MERTFPSPVCLDRRSLYSISIPRTLLQAAPKKPAVSGMPMKIFWKLGLRSLGSVQILWIPMPSSLQDGNCHSCCSPILS
ncbi:UNVERIFIED_CONTAM: hypothetical protein GTU68_003519 [Idotea baltica]|nr:hypothetical protein [Idotea baltica]